MGISGLVESAAAAALFAAMFYFGYRVRLGVFRDQDVIASVSAGISAAYVFVHVMPELTHLREEVAHGPIPLPNQGGIVYFAALVGFLVFYGIDSMHVRVRKVSEPANRAAAAFRIQIGGFAIYAWLVSYLLVRGVNDSAKSELMYTIALAVHFLTVSKALHHEHGALYDRTGSVVLAGMVAAGWVTGLAVDFRVQVTSLLMAFISGAVIINSTIEELPAEQQGHFLPFVSGGLAYGAILLMVG